MIKPTLRRSRPRGLMRWLLRVPVWLYRHGLGWLLGRRFIMIEHTGRRSGLTRYTVVEVVRREAATGAIVVASAWGERADWYRNIRKTPEVRVTSGRERRAMVAERLDVNAAAAALCDYAARHPVAFRALARMMAGDAVAASPAACVNLAGEVPVIRLLPRIRNIDERGARHFS